jgi:nucleotide-binding universal stress UspA family protein
MAAPTAGELGPIVLGTDLEDVSIAPEEAAIALAAAEGRDLVIVHAIDLGRLRLPGGRFVRRIDQVRAARESELAAVVGRARAAGVDARALVWVGSAAECIVDAARAEGAARIMVGSHRRGRLGRLIAGSVAGDVLAAAPCRVDVVVPGATPAVRPAEVPAALSS